MPLTFFVFSISYSFGTLIAYAYPGGIMIVAIPLFGDSVAPRFGFADKALIATISENGVDREETIHLVEGGLFELLGQLRGMGVEVLLCGGFNRRFVPLAESMGFSIYAGLSGHYHQILESFVRGDRMPTAFCEGKGLGQGKGKAKCLTRSGGNRSSRNRRGGRTGK